MAIKKLTNANNVFSDDNLSNLIYGLLGNDTVRCTGGYDFCASALDRCARTGRADPCGRLLHISSQR